MTTVKVQKNQIIAKQKEKVKKWYIVQEGTVIQCNSYAKIVLGKNAVIGISEGDRYLCDYVANRGLPCCAVFNSRIGGSDLNGGDSRAGEPCAAILSSEQHSRQRQMLLRTYARF